MTRNSSLVKCRSCGADIAANADRCPKCGGINLRRLTPGGALLLVGVVAGGIWFFTGGERIENRVAKDSMDRYSIAQKGNDKMEICMYAGIVATAFNQANDEKAYLHWKDVERSDCAAAGLKK